MYALNNYDVHINCHGKKCIGVLSHTACTMAIERGKHACYSMYKPTN